ncbi:hypothetical protein HAX54_047973 [Datura stramonium]|uniref:Uncharacterized protein n=1 Tax=Datura stramonium TaxID=4076 RepID=A0ABS8WKQ7_DATST|nr:hypothetical protein [Datura stramonium]
MSVQSVLSGGPVIQIRYAKSFQQGQRNADPNSSCLRGPCLESALRIGGCDYRLETLTQPYRRGVFVYSALTLCISKLAIHG